jgi:CRISPR system Cascade subunit CasB
MNQTPLESTPEAKETPQAESFTSRQTRAVVALQRAIETADPGTQASLRRADPASPPAAFYRVTVRILDDILSGEGPSRDAMERAWVVIASAMARASGMLAPVPLGEAMAKAGVAEMRLLRLLEARGDQLADIVRNVVHQLTQKGQRFDPRDLANLVLTDGTEFAREPRRRIARNYYRHQAT